jgi:hypothetical protein
MSAERRYSEDRPDTSRSDVGLIRIELCYFGKAVAVKHPDGRATSSGCISGLQEDFCACLSVFIITLCLSIGLRQNWCHWKAKKKSYNLNIWTASVRPTVRTASRITLFLKVVFERRSLKTVRQDGPQSESVF